MKTYDIVIVALLAAAAAVFQLAHGIIGIPTGFGMTVDLVAVPVLLAFFIFGLEHSLWVLLIASIVITLVAPDSWLGASMKFSATLPMVLIPAFYLLSREKKASFPLLAALAVFAAFAVLVLPGSANIAAQSTALQLNRTSAYSVPGFSLQGTEVIKGTTVTAGMLLLGLLPIAVLILLSAVLLYIWKKYAGAVALKPLRNAHIAIVVLVAALAVRALATVVSNYYYAGPLFFGMSTETFMSAVPWYLIAGWNCFQGILEFGIAWVLAYGFGFAKSYGDWAG